MDDKTKSVGTEHMAGRGDEYTSRRPGSVVDDPTRGQTSPRRTTTVRPESTPSTSGEDSPDVRTREIRSEIERTREDMSETVNAIQERLSPRHVVSEAVEGVKSAAGETVRSVADSEPVQYARANPVPSAMIGIGLIGAAWLAFSDTESRRSRYRRVASSADWQAGSERQDEDYYRARRFAAAGASSEPGSRYRTAAYDPDLRGSYEPWQRSTGWSAGRLQRMLEQNPLLLGATTALIGAVIGVAIPETQRENQLMGQARDSVVSGVQDTVRETVNKVQSATSEVIEKVAGEGAAAPGQPGEPGQAGQSGRSAQGGRGPPVAGLSHSRCRAEPRYFHDEILDERALRPADPHTSRRQWTKPSRPLRRRSHRISASSSRASSSSSTTGRNNRRARSLLRIPAMTPPRPGCGGAQGRRPAAASDASSGRIHPPPEVLKSCHRQGTSSKPWSWRVMDMGRLRYIPGDR
jgi:hypothetical protein